MGLYLGKEKINNLSVGSTGGLKPATVTITSSASGDTGNVNAMFMFTNSEGHID